MSELGQLSDIIIGQFFWVLYVLSFDGWLDTNICFTHGFGGKLDNLVLTNLHFPTLNLGFHVFFYEEVWGRLFD